jgi:hypothetical protein
MLCPTEGLVFVKDAYEGTQYCKAHSTRIVTDQSRKATRSHLRWLVKTTEQKMSNKK